MNKQNEYNLNQISTGIHDSISKTYSSKYMNQTHKKVNKKILPSRYEKQAIKIQRFWRHYLLMRRLASQKLIQQVNQTNQCYKLQNKILQKLVSQYEQIVKYKQLQIKTKIQEQVSDYEMEISQIKKQCVIANFKLDKKNPKKQLLQEIINKKEEERLINLELNKNKFIIDEELEEQKRLYQSLLRQYKQLNMQHLQLVKEKNQLNNQYKEKMLQTSKFGSNNLNKLESTKCRNLNHEYLMNNQHKNRENNE